MPSLIHKERKSPSNTSDSVLATNDTDKQPEKYDVKRRDWSAMLMDFDTDAGKAKSDDTTVSADQVIENLGLKTVVPGLKNRVGTVSSKRTDVKPKSKMEEKQALEEVMGRGDSIRAKYAAKIFQKKMLAEARREQAKLGIFPTAAPKASS